MGTFAKHVEVEEHGSRADYVLRDEIAPTVMCFREEFAGEWLWRPALFEAAARAGARGIYGTYPQPSEKRPEIEIQT
jgi:hypothetical protein